MKNILLTFILLIFINVTFGQNVKNNSELCVINMLGAKVYEKPTFDSKTLSELPIGENIIVEKSIETKERFRIGENFSLSGKWIKPNGINGFVFSSDLTDKKADISPNEYGQTNLNLRGKLISEKSEEKQIKTENGVFPKYFEYKYYENGTYTYTSWDGCFDHVTEYKNLTLNEVYHQMVSNYCNELVTKYKAGKWTNSRKLGDASQQIQLSGKYYLEIPASNQSAQKLQRFREIAAEYGTENQSEGIIVTFLTE